eukprot:gene2393-3123_t
MANTATLAAKERGTKAYKNENFVAAVVAYSEALAAASDSDPDRHLYYSNRCAAHLNLGKFDDALADAEGCVRLKPDSNAEAWFHMAWFNLQQNKQLMYGLIAVIVYLVFFRSSGYSGGYSDFGYGGYGGFLGTGYDLWTIGGIALVGWVAYKKVAMVVATEVATEVAWEVMGDEDMVEE